MVERERAMGGEGLSWKQCNSNSLLWRLQYALLVSRNLRLRWRGCLGEWLRNATRLKIAASGWFEILTVVLRTVYGLSRLAAFLDSRWPVRYSGSSVHCTNIVPEVFL